jgi:hypothetical protein
MGLSRHSRIGLAALAAAALAAGVAVTAALGNVTVYNSTFSARADIQGLKKAGGGKQCARRLVTRGTPRMRAIVRSGPTNCRFRPPVQGDSPLPNYTFRVDARIARSGPRRARATAFLVVRARAGEGTGYTLRVLPRRGRWELHRAPASPQFPLSGRSEAINGIRGLNRVRLVTDGAEIRAFVNGELLAEVTDANPGAVTGTMLHFGVGHDARTRDRLFAAFNRLRVAVPSP